MKDKIRFNEKVLMLSALIAFMAPAVLSGCSNNGNTDESQELPVLTAEQGEHARDVEGREGAGEHSGERGEGEHSGERGEGEHGEEGEESGTEYTLTDAYDQVRNGARLILNFDAESNSFVGTVENTTEKILTRVRVEVHLSNGIELGPTTPTDLKPGEKRRVRLTATSTDFDKWSAHPEVGSGDEG